MSEHPHFLWKDPVIRDRTGNDSLIETLRNNILFSTLNARELRHLSYMVYERVFQPNEFVFQEESRGFGMYIIARGKIEIRTGLPEPETLITTLNAGSFFGELALIDPDNVRTASAVALEKAVLIGFFKPDLIEIIGRKPAMGVKILLQLSKVLGRRLLETTEKITLMERTRRLQNTG